MKRKNILSLEIPGFILLTDKNTKEEIILAVEKLSIKLYELL